ncbi:hypothetical protein [Desulforapulum autotrophicum]|uniref:hypothetical protein n=1 Tax=Desulforapulum autotrophicum TaxID=2296 RepID=UPI0002E55BBA|nr:hypothetical protein [Desulforapulum autotrophicum]
MNASLEAIHHCPWYDMLESWLIMAKGHGDVNMMVMGKDSLSPLFLIIETSRIYPDRTASITAASGFPDFVFDFVD